MGARDRGLRPGRRHEARQLLPDVDFASGPYAAVEGADALVIITEWDEFRALDLDRVKDVMRGPLVVDLRNIYPREAMAALGFRYEGIGRGAGV